jgi:hypothetical protein
LNSLKNNKNSQLLGYFYQLNILKDPCGMEANTNYNKFLNKLCQHFA